MVEDVVGVTTKHWFLKYVWLLKICLFLQGLRHSVFLGSLGTCLGSWIKVFATNQAHFPIMFAGQTVVAISQIFILGKVFEKLSCEQLIIFAGTAHRY